jgi:hypothetical protein
MVPEGTPQLKLGWKGNLYTGPASVPYLVSEVTVGRQAVHVQVEVLARRAGAYTRPLHIST